MMSELRLSLERPTPGAPDQVEHAWADGLAERLLKLHDELVLHFREEEDSGFFDSLATEFPHLTRRLDDLEAEHAWMLREARDIVSSCMSFAEAGPGIGQELSDRTLHLLSRLEAHEQAENELIQRAYAEDLGAAEAG
jgi:hypothetical protein